MYGWGRDGLVGWSRDPIIGLVGPLREFLPSLRRMRSPAGTEVRDTILWKHKLRCSGGNFLPPVWLPFWGLNCHLPLAKDSSDSLPLHFLPEWRLGAFWARAEAILGAANNRSDVLQFVSHYENFRHEHNKRTEWGHLVLFMSSETGERNHLSTVQSGPVGWSLVDGI